jgi:hypothetical protein
MTLFLDLFLVRKKRKTKSRDSQFSTPVPISIKIICTDFNFNQIQICQFLCVTFNVRKTNMRKFSMQGLVCIRKSRSLKKRLVLNLIDKLNEKEKSFLTLMHFFVKCIIKLNSIHVCGTLKLGPPAASIPSMDSGHGR